MNRATAATLEVGGALKALVLWVGSFAVAGYGLWELVHGQWGLALLLFIVGVPVWLFLADIATGLILVPIVALAALVGYGLGKKGRDALEIHLRSKNIDKMWWPSVKAAVANCDVGDYFAPVLTFSGPVSSRNVVLLLDLEEFVRRPIDWSESIYE